MKKIVLFLFISIASFAQNGIIGDGFSTGWSNPSNVTGFDAGAGGSRIKTLNPNGTGNRYFRMVKFWDDNNSEFGPFGCSDVDWSNKSGEKYENMPICTNGAFYINCPNTTDNYVFKTPSGPSDDFVYFRVQGAVRSVSSVSQVPLVSNVVVGQDVVVTANLDGAFSTGQAVYIRYSKDAFATSTVTEMSGSGTTYTATIPAAFNTANANVAYYVFTSGNGLTISGADADWFTINLNSNGGTNYNYTVSNTWTSTVGATNWSNPASWSAGSVPNTGANIVISNSITLDVDANVSGISIATTKTLTVNSGVTLRVSGTVSNTGTGALQVNGALQLDNGYNISISPSYGSNSTLIYNSGGSPTRANEWPGVNSPASVTIQNSTNLSLADARSISKDFTLQDNGTIRTTGEQILTFNGTYQTISVESSGRIRGTDEGFGNNLTLNILAGSVTTISGDATSTSDEERKFYNINVFSGGTLALSRGLLCKYGTFTVEGTLQINANGYVQSSVGGAQAAIYGATAKLIYNTGGDYTTTNFEWPATNSPFDVSVKNVGTNVILNGAKTINGTLFLENGTLTNGANLTLGNGATINRTGGNLTAYPSGTSYNVVYGAHSQGFSTSFELPTSSTALNNLTISNGNTITLNDNVTINGNFNLTDGSLVLADKTLNRNTSGGTFTMGANTSLSIGSTNSFPSNYVSHTLDATSTVEYNGTDQNITKLSSDYGKLILSNSGTKTLADDVQTAGDFTIQNTAVSQISSDNSITIGGDFKVLDDADFTVNNNAYLIQTKAGTNANTGSIKVNRAANIKRLDIVLWSPPVASQNLLDFSPQTLLNRFFQFSTGANNWSVMPDVATQSMGATNGYAIRAPNDWSTSVAAFTGLFTGVPNSGNYTASIESSGQRFNLVGNPYPSTLNLRSLYDANSSLIENKFYFYEHTQSPANVTSSITNYGVMTVGATTAYVTATDSPQSSNVANIESAESAQVGQGFFVRALTGESGSLSFTNAMRGGNNNTVFFRNNVTSEEVSFEASVFRIRFTDPNLSKSQALVGCFEDTNDGDDVMDTEGIGAVVYTFNQNKKLAIQGRSFPLNQGSVIPLGFRTGIAGTHKIDLIEQTGIFQTQQYVLLHDLQLGLYHNLSLSPYEFTTETGTFDNRFVIVFTGILNNDQPISLENQLTLFEMNDQLHLHAKENIQLKSIKIYNLTGSLIHEENDVEILQNKTLSVSKSNSLMVVKVTTQDSKDLTYKVIF